MVHDYIVTSSMSFLFYPTEFVCTHTFLFRRRMSKYLRAMGGYYNMDRTFFYQDTDSMIINQSSFEILEKKGFIGSNLGQLENEFPNDYIVSARFLAPKTYCLMLLKKTKVEGKYAIAFKIRCKVGE